MKREIEWTAGTGQRIVITVEDNFELNTQGQRKTAGYREAVISATVDGNPVDAAGGLKAIEHPQVAATFGKIGMIPENYQRVLAAVEEVRTSFAEHNAAVDRHAESLDATTAEGEQIERTMRHGE